MRATRRTVFGALAAMGAAGVTSRIASAAKPPDNGGFGATASVSVNSGNNSGNQTVSYQENQAILTMDANGNVQLAQGNAAGDASVQQGQASSPAIVAADGQPRSCLPPDFSVCQHFELCQPDGSVITFITLACANKVGSGYGHD